MKKRIIKVIANYILAIILCGLLSLIVYKLGFGIPCIFHKITGLKCAGCGNTRAVISLIQLDFKKAFSYNAMILPELAYILWITIYSSKIYIKTGVKTISSSSKTLDIVFMIILFAWTIFRNL